VISKNKLIFFNSYFFNTKNNYFLDPCQNFFCPHLKKVTEKKLIVSNWLTKKIAPVTEWTTLILVFLLLCGSFIYQSDIFQAKDWMSASYNDVFIKREYWRLWTTLFAHADFGHIFGNLFMFVPFAFILTGYFGPIYFPLIGFILGGLTNALVLQTMPPEIELIGVSGVVYWMGATYLMLSFFIDRRESTLKRVIKNLGIALILFFPDTLKVEVSYLSHFIGFILGLVSGAILYKLNQKKFEALEVVTIFDDEDEKYEWYENMLLSQKLFEEELERSKAQSSIKDQTENAEDRSYHFESM
jgi:rhomboid protease GluP